MTNINSLTHFVAKNDDFISFVKELGDLNNECSSILEDLSKSKMKNEEHIKNKKQPNRSKY